LCRYSFHAKREIVIKYHDANARRYRPTARPHAGGRIEAHYPERPLMMQPFEPAVQR
jgi:hypothetical protein